MGYMKIFLYKYKSYAEQVSHPTLFFPRSPSQFFSLVLFGSPHDFSSTFKLYIHAQFMYLI